MLQTEINNVLVEGNVDESFLKDDEKKLSDDPKDLYEIIMDLSIDKNIRLRSLERYHLSTPHQTTDVINRLAGMYQFSGTSMLRKYLSSICTDTSIPSNIKILCAYSLCSFKDKKAYGCLNHVCDTFDCSISTPCRIEAIKLLMECDDFKKNTLDYFCSIVTSPAIDPEYRYKTILGVEDKPFYLYNSCYKFFSDKENTPVRYRILAAQNMLNSSDDEHLSGDIRMTIEDEMLAIANDHKLYQDDNIRADAADVLLGCSERLRERAREIIFSIGLRGKDTGDTFFNNSQNVHIKSLEDSSKTILKFLESVPYQKIDDVPIDKKYVDSQIHELVSNSSKHQTTKVNIALNRIEMDRAVYVCSDAGTFGLTFILLKLWSYISTHDQRDELCIRLLDELCDMAGTCSSGYILRLLNVLSGFDNFQLRISWEEQLIANVIGRLNARINQIEDDKVRDLVLEEMTVPCGEYEKRLNFLKFFRQHISEIKEELYDEFKIHISNDEFDLYFRKAIMKYEGVF